MPAISQKLEAEALRNPAKKKSIPSALGTFSSCKAEGRNQARLPSPGFSMQGFGFVTDRRFVPVLFAKQRQVSRNLLAKRPAKPKMYSLGI